MNGKLLNLSTTYVQKSKCKTPYFQTADKKLCSTSIIRKNENSLPKIGYCVPFMPICIYFIEKLYDIDDRGKSFFKLY